MIAPWYTMAYVKLTRIAMRYGYALALHGSMARDLDLIAIPWVNDAEPEKMLKAFARFITLKADVSYPIPKPTEKPHGRMAYSFPIGHNGHFLDISIMPRLEDRLEFLRDDGIDHALYYQEETGEGA